MNITIDYDGSTAICKINGKPINKASVLEVTQTFSAFRTIKNAYKRERSKEDEHWTQKAIDFIKHPDLIKATPTLAKHTIDWLKTLKERIGE